MPLPYTEISGKRVGRGTNVGAATIEPMLVVGFSPNTATGFDDPIDTLSVATAAHMKGVTTHPIDPGTTGDVHSEGVLPVQSDGTGPIAKGDWLSAVQGAGPTVGMVFTVPAPATGAVGGLAPITYYVGQAQSDAPAVVGAIVMVDLHLGVMG